LIQPFQQPELVVGFFATYRKQYPVSRNTTGWPIVCARNESHSSNALTLFLNCADPKRLRELADSLTSRDLLIDRVSAGLAPAFRGATDTSMPVRQSPRPRGEGRWAEGV